LAVPEGIVQGITKSRGKVKDLILGNLTFFVGRVLFCLQGTGVFHGTNHGFYETERIQGRFLTGQVVIHKSLTCATSNSLIYRRHPATKLLVMKPGER
jgi:hypothetical protein